MRDFLPSPVALALRDEVVELTAVIAFQNMSARFNAAPQADRHGFCKCRPLSRPRRPPEPASPLAAGRVSHSRGTHEHLWIESADRHGQLLSEQARRRRARPSPGRHPAQRRSARPHRLPALGRCGRLRLGGGPALVQTVDFFRPIVDDPYVFGEIAAANSLGDVYAMGGRPLTALAVAGFPQEGIDRDVIAAVFRGGYDKLAEAGVALLGGHTVQDPEIKFGYAVTGAIDARRIWSNVGARPGDHILLTKPIGTGVAVTVVKNRRVPEPLLAQAIEMMRTLNKAAAEALATVDGVHACTDVTGFGLIGHASEVATASGVTLTIEAAEVPLLQGVRALVRRNRNGGMVRNREHYGGGVEVDAGVDDDVMDLLYDPQTSGGLLVLIAAELATAALHALREKRAPGEEIGIAIEPTGTLIDVR